MLADGTDNIQIIKHCKVTSPDKTAVEFLSGCTPLSKQKIKQAMTNGCVWLESTIGTHRLRRSKKILSLDTTLHLYYDTVIQNATSKEATLISDEDEYSIWNKPYGMFSQGSKWGDHCTIYRWAETHLKPERPAFIVHRLDRAASGLIVLAHSKKMAKHFSELFSKRRIVKRYKATVEGNLEDLILPNLITIEIENKPAISKILSVKQGKNTALITIEIETGRKHQIRKHLSESGYPIVGDRLYGSGLSNENLQLQSYYLKFDCPITETSKEYSI